MPKTSVILQKAADYLCFWHFSFGSICSKSHRKALVYNQSVVKKCCEVPLSYNCFGIDTIVETACFQQKIHANYDTRQCDGIIRNRISIFGYILQYFVILYSF